MSETETTAALAPAARSESEGVGMGTILFDAELEDAERRQALYGGTLLSMGRAHRRRRSAISPGR